MTRRSLNRTLHWVYVVLAGVLVLAAASKLSEHVPGFGGTSAQAVIADVYLYLKDMSLVFVTVVAAYLANIFQKRASFTDALRQEWRGIVDTKLALVAYCEKTYPTSDDYIDAYCRISGALDNMRIVYRNVGETKDLIGLYPFAPLHDMRRALETLDPRKNPKITQDQRMVVRTAIEQAFYALRERFLDELDLEEPTNPLTAAAASRTKTSGATPKARQTQDRQRKQISANGKGNSEVNAFLWDLYYAEVAETHAHDQEFINRLNGDLPDKRAQTRM